MTIPTLRELMAAGAHFGHKKERSHPKARVFTYTIREGIYIIDLQKTQEALERASAVAAEFAKSGKTILFVGTKPQAADLVKAAAQSVDMPYMTHRWPGGLLTNFDTVLQNLKQLDAMEAKLAGEEANYMTKKEKQVMSEKIRKTTETLGGVRNLRRAPDVLFVVDVVAESTAIAEAYRLGIPIIAICDTNANPELVTYPIPANDDARKAIELIVNYITAAIAANKPAPIVADEKPVLEDQKIDVETTPTAESTSPEESAKSAPTSAESGVRSSDRSVGEIKNQATDKATEPTGEDTQENEAPADPIETIKEDSPATNETQSTEEKPKKTTRAKAKEKTKVVAVSNDK